MLDIHSIEDIEKLIEKHFKPLNKEIKELKKKVGSLEKTRRKDALEDRHP